MAKQVPDAETGLALSYSAAGDAANRVSPSDNSHDRPSLLKNLGEHWNWILLKLEGKKSNRDAVGAKVTVRAGDHQQTEEVRSSGYISQSDFRLHFELGNATKADAIEMAKRSRAALRERRGQPHRKNPRKHRHYGKLNSALAADIRRPATKTLDFAYLIYLYDPIKTKGTLHVSRRQGVGPESPLGVSGTKVEN